MQILLLKVLSLQRYFSKFISNNFNYCTDEGEFSYELKHVDVIPLHKKDKCVKEKYRPGSTVPNQCGFRKGDSAQQYVLIMIKKFKEAIVKGHDFGALLTYLSKAFDCTDHKT